MFRKTNFLAIILFLLMIGYACNNDNTPEPVDEPYGTIQFSAFLSSSSGGRTDCSIEDVSSILLTIQPDGDQSSIELEVDLEFINSVIQTKPIELPAGMYWLTSFEALDTNGNPTAYAPGADDPLAGFVSNALDIPFEVELLAKNSIDVDLLCIDDEEFPFDFGFELFDPSIINIKKLYVFSNYCDPELGHTVGQIEGNVYFTPDDEEPIWSGSSDPDSDNPEDRILCIPFPVFPEGHAKETEQFYVTLTINNEIKLSGVVTCDLIDDLEAANDYLHLFEMCDPPVPDPTGTFEEDCEEAQVGLFLAPAPCNHGGVAYNPEKDLYYKVRAGSSVYFLRTYDSNGNILFETPANFDFRNLWWNPNTNSLEGNGFANGGYRVVDLDANGYALGSGTNTPGQNQPTTQSMCEYDYDADEVIHYHDGRIYRFDHQTVAPLGNYPITGLPVPFTNLNDNTVGYSGVAGKEIMVYDRVEKKVYFINKANGQYVGEIQLPADAPVPASFNMSFANDEIWLGDCQVYTSYSLDYDCL